MNAPQINCKLLQDSIPWRHYPAGPLVPGWWGGDPADGCRVLTSLAFSNSDIDILNQYRDVVADDVGETDCSTKE